MSVGRILERAPRLRWLCSPTTGHDHLNEEALAARGVRILSLRGERAFLENIRATPEHTFGLILALLRRNGQVFAATLGGDWDRDRFRGEELFGNQVGIVGLGRVGYRVATYCTAFGAHVHWHDPVDVLAEPQWRRVATVESLVDTCRILVVCARLSPGQPPVVDRAAIDRMSGHYVINTARGELVDEDALLDAIRRGRLAGVATDVMADEQSRPRLREWRALAKGRNLILTPHIGGATIDAMARTERFIADKLVAEIARAQAST